MVSQRVQRQIDRLLNEAEEAIGRKQWELVRENARAVLALDPDNEDARAFLAAAERALAAAQSGAAPLDALGSSPVPLGAASTHPRSFCGGRYQVVRLLGEGGKKRVYLAHDTKLDRDVAFALIKTEGPWTLDLGPR